MSRSEMLCVGEILWDALPSGLFLGGAPRNVAFHLRQLGQAVGMVGRVGTDRLGVEALRRLADEGISTRLVQADAAYATGVAEVSLDEHGAASYAVSEPAAWDAIEFHEALRHSASRAMALVFGSLAQRGAVSRRTIERLCDLPVYKVFDANLRPPHVERAVVERGLACANLVKLNEDELRQAARWFGFSGVPAEASAALAEAFDCATVCVTFGAAGAGLWHGGEWAEHPGYRVAVRDSVGAGDAFLAALVANLFNGIRPAEALRRANLLGAFVATRPGAVPAHDPAALARIEAQHGVAAGRSPAARAVGAGA